MVVYDAAIIGAGADGLAAAALLARAGLNTIVLERDAAAGGRCTTREFHPGFRASPFADEIAAIPSELFWSLDLARRGAFFMPTRPSRALWPGGRGASLEGSESAARLLAAAQARRRGVLARAQEAVAVRPRWSLPFGAKPAEPWPAEDWAGKPLESVLGSEITDRGLAALAAAEALAGRAADPYLPGSALHLLAPGRGSSGQPPGGLGTLASALEGAAREAGAQLAFGLETSDIRHERGRVRGVILADGTEIAARAVISTLDLKRTFLSLFSWSDLPSKLTARVNAFRMAASTARLLLALEKPPEPSAAAGSFEAAGILYVAPEIAALAAACSAWRAGMLAEALPLAVRVPSAADPSLAPSGAATMTVTIGAVPARLFDGAWTHEKRDCLRDRVLAQIESVLPGTSARVRGAQLIVPPDMEDTLALTGGDLAGGEIAPDQMLGQRPWNEDAPPPRTPLRGLYLAGPSTTAGLLASCAAGAAAARAVIADSKAGRLA